MSPSEKFADRANRQPLKRDAHATRQRIIEAAFAEFAAAGLAGARVERIAANARCNKSLIFVYFESKAALFMTVVRQELERLKEKVPFPPADIPQFAANMFDFAMEHPNSMRLLAWYGLERETSSGVELAPCSFSGGLPIKSGTSFGELDFPFPAKFPLTAIVALSAAWSQANPVRHLFGFNESDLPSSVRRLVVEGTTRLME